MRLPSPKRLIILAAFVAVLVFSTLAIVELGTLALFRLAPELLPPRDAIEQSLADREPNSADPAQRGGANILHPYLGYVRNAQPGRKIRVNRFLVDDEVNALGFLGKSSLAPKGDDVVRIAFTGGSVAEELFLYGRDTMASELAAAGAFGGRKIEIVSVAIAGYKQPQQLFALSYLLMIGAHLDVVINLDGFNEVVLPFTDNVPLKLSPSYPFRWRSVAADGIEPGAAKMVSQIADLERDSQQWRRFFHRFPLRHSAFAMATWQVIRERNETSRSALGITLRERLGENTKAQSGGPPFDRDAHGGGPGALFAYSASIWRRSSEALASLCASRGIEYFHFLQPNQYFESKRSAESQRTLSPKHNSTRIAAEAGYRSLTVEGKKLRTAGVRFADLAGVFDEETEPIYRDNCCHFFARGYQIVAREIASQIAASTSENAAASIPTPPGH